MKIYKIILDSNTTGEEENIIQSIKDTFYEDLDILPKYLTNFQFSFWNDAEKTLSYHIDYKSRDFSDSLKTYKMIKVALNEALENVGYYINNSNITFLHNYIFVTCNFGAYDDKTTDDSIKDAENLPFDNVQGLKRFLSKYKNKYFARPLKVFEYDDGEKVLTTDILDKYNNVVGRVEFDPKTLKLVNNHNQVFFTDDGDYSVTENGGNFSIVNKQNKTVYQTKDKNKVTQNLQNLNSNKPIQDTRHNCSNRAINKISNHIS